VVRDRDLDYARYIRGSLSRLVVSAAVCGTAANIRKRTAHVLEPQEDKNQNPLEVYVVV
jgi:hypothetical protein